MARSEVQCVDGGRCEMQTDTIPACKRSCSILHTHQRREMWQQVQRLAQDGNMASLKFLRRAASAGLE